MAVEPEVLRENVNLLDPRLGNLAVEGGFVSRTLFTDTREIIIQHEDERYRLRLTSNNKLILTK